MGSEPTASIESRLNGWKEIASYLGKSVRTVLRWEREYGLPVRRISTPEGGQIVFAVKAEIDQWLMKAPAKTDATVATREVLLEQVEVAERRRALSLRLRESAAVILSVLIGATTSVGALLGSVQIASRSVTVLTFLIVILTLGIITLVRQLRRPSHELASLTEVVEAAFINALERSGLNPQAAGAPRG